MAPKSMKNRERMGERKIEREMQGKADNGKKESREQLWYSLNNV